MQRNCGLDFLKVICCFLVICIHAPFPKPITLILIPLSRVAVPIFFIITGYFYNQTKEKNTEKKQIFKISRLLFLSNIVYFLWEIIKNLHQEKTLAGFIPNYLNWRKIINFLLFNESPFGGHLWYLGAILYVLIIIFLFEKFFPREKLYPLIPLLLTTDLILGKYSLLFFEISPPTILARNFIFVGFPYFLLGDYLFNTPPKIKQRTLRFLSLFFSFTTLLEYFLLEKFNINAIRDHYISTTFLAFSLFLLALNWKPCLENNIFKKTCFIGYKLSLYIYISHPITIYIFDQMILYTYDTFLYTALSYLKPILIFVFSLFISLIFFLTSSKYKLSV